MLHVAPEPPVQQRLVQVRPARYVSVDIELGRAMLTADLTELPFESASFDLVICSHVLEHIPDDRAALSEIRRTLRAGGIALLQFPVNYDQPLTYEDPADSDPQSRLRRFSQSDHVRVYGADVFDRLYEAGFAVEVFSASECDEGVRARLGLDTPYGPLRNEVYCCTPSVDGEPVGP